MRSRSHPNERKFLSAEGQSKMKLIHILFSLILISPLLTACSQTVAPAPGVVFVRLDLGGGGSGFAATLYAQEVNTGATVHQFQSAGSHGQVVLPTSEPLKFELPPGVYVFYATLINNPDDYHYGAIGCAAGQDCPDSALYALEVVSGGVYHIAIAERRALLPTPGAPVVVPWRK